MRRDSGLPSPRCAAGTPRRNRAPEAKSEPWVMSPTPIKAIREPAGPMPRRRWDPGMPVEFETGQEVARVRLGSYEFKKKGVSRFDLRDPYHLAIALTWPQFFAALLPLYLSVNVVFAALFWLVPGSIARARPNSFSSRMPSSSASRHCRRSVMARCTRHRRTVMWSRRARSFAGSPSPPS